MEDRTRSETHPNPRERLRRIIEAKSLMRGGEFTLASGRQSSFFFNMKQTMLDPEGADLLADAVLDVLEREGARNVGGLEMGAVPLVAAVCVKSHGRYPVNAFYVRKQQKDHGARQRIDGHLDPEADTIVVEDVTTTGGSALQAVEAVRERGARVATVLTIVDRLEGARETLKAHGLELVALYTREDFAD